MSISLSPATRGAGALAFAAAFASAVPVVALAASSRPTLKSPVEASWAEDNPTAGAVFEVQQGRAVTFKVKSPDGPIFVVVGKTDDELRNVTEDSIKRSVYVRQMTPKSGDVFVNSVPVYPAFEGFWTNRPKTYWWTAVRVDCAAAKQDDDCVLEAEPRAFKVRKGTIG